MANKVCTKCGASVGTSDKFCMSCGSTEFVDSSNKKTGVVSTQSNKKFPTWAKVLIIIGIVLFVPVACTVACTAGLAGAVDDINNELNETIDDYNSSINDTTESSKDDDSDAPNNQKDDTVVSNEKFTLIEHKKSDESNDYFMYIEGKIKNNKTKSYSYVQVTFKTFDKEGNLIGTCLDNVNNLDGSATWKFKAICTEGVDEIAKYELGEITGW